MFEPDDIFKNDSSLEFTQRQFLSSSMLRLNRMTLAFIGKSAEIENDYIKEYNRGSLSTLRWGILLGIIFIGMFAILDYLYIYEKKNILWTIRFAIMIPAGIIVFLLSLIKSMQRWMQLLTSLFGFIAGVSIVYMTTFTSQYYAGLILVTMFTYAIIKLRFIYASITSWSIFILYNFVAIHLVPTPVDVLLSNNFFFFSANVIGMIMGYQLESSSRKNYFLLRLNEQKHELELEATKLRIANRMAATIAHEFNTPLCVLENIYNLTELNNIEEDQWRVHLEKIPRQVEKMKVLVDKLLKIREYKEKDYAAGMKIFNLHESN